MLLLVACTLAGTTAVPARTALSVTSAERGKILFQHKGCVTCHHNSRIEYEGRSLNIGPDLSRYAADPAFLRQWLADPAAIRPATQMPDLQLTPTDIEELIAFLNQQD